MNKYQRHNHYQLAKAQAHSKESSLPLEGWMFGYNLQCTSDEHKTPFYVSRATIDYYLERNSYRKNFNRLMDDIRCFEHQDWNRDTPPLSPVSS